MRRLWVDAPTLLIIGAALALVVAMAAMLDEQGPAAGAAPTLQDFERGNPHLSVREEHVADPAADRQRAGIVLLHLQDRTSGARATLREDFLLGHVVRLQACPPMMPVAPGLREVQCAVAAATADRPEVLWLAARLPVGAEGPDAEHEKLQPFYARAEAMSIEHEVALHRISVDRVAVGLQPRGAAAAGAAAGSAPSQ